MTADTLIIGSFGIMSSENSIKNAKNGNFIGERLKIIRNSLNMGNQSQFAEKLGINQATLSKYEIGTSDIPEDIKLKLSAFGINLHWLITGVGEPFFKPVGIGAGAGFASPGQGIGANAGPYALNTQSPAYLQKSPSGEGYKLPLLRQKVSCGSGESWESEENIEEYIEIQSLIPRLGISRIFAVKAQGSSMLGAGIRNGDYLLFDGKTEVLPIDGNYIFALDGDVYCKRLEFDKLAKKINIFSVRVSDLEKAELVTSIDTGDQSSVDRFKIFGKVTSCVRLMERED